MIANLKPIAIVNGNVILTLELTQIATMRVTVFVIVFQKAIGIVFPKVIVTVFRIECYSMIVFPMVIVCWK